MVQYNSSTSRGQRYEYNRVLVRAWISYAYASTAKLRTYPTRLYYEYIRDAAYSTRINPLIQYIQKLWEYPSLCRVFCSFQLRDSQGLRRGGGGGGGGLAGEWLCLLPMLGYRARNIAAGIRMLIALTN